jgi:hypothetical protein
MKIRGFFWTSNEWAPAFVDSNKWINKIVKNEKKALVYAGWFDKLTHWLLHFLFVLTSVLGVPIWFTVLFSELFGALWEGPVDCWVFNHGASKLDFVFNNLGMVCCYLLLIVAHYINPLFTLRFWF